MSYGVAGINKKRLRLWQVALIVFIFLGLGDGVYVKFVHKTASPTVVYTSPVPKAISQAVSFPIYYPDSSKLPPGYRLSTASFTKPVNNGVSYSVVYDSGKKLVFSIQKKPSDNELESFKSNYIPLRIDYETPIGTAEIGAYNNHGDIQTLVSLPTKLDAWIIVTAPYDTNQDKLKQVLKSLRQ